MNKFIVLLLLGALLYGLYRYHQQNLNQIEPDTAKPVTVKSVKQLKTLMQKKNKKSTRAIAKNEPDNVSIGNISQLSVGSIDADESNFKQDSAVNSLDSKDSLSFLDNRSTGSNKSFFFK